MIVAQDTPELPGLRCFDCNELVIVNAGQVGHTGVDCGAFALAKYQTARVDEVWHPAGFEQLFAALRPIDEYVARCRWKAGAP